MRNAKRWVVPGFAVVGLVLLLVLVGAQTYRSYLWFQNVSRYMAVSIRILNYNVDRGALAIPPELKPPAAGQPAQPAQPAPPPPAAPESK